MQRPNSLARLAAAAVAVAVTLGVFAGVASFAEPQRSALIAKAAAVKAVASAPAAVRVAQVQ